MKYKTATAAAIFAAALSACCTSCNTITDDALPALPVNINLSPVSVWNTYGVTAFGSYRHFVMQNSEPSGFPYIGQSATGFGGVLLVCGFNPYTTDAGVPMAYDLACPVERRAEVRVRMKATDTFPMAVCPECGSTYNVVEHGGAPESGPAAASRLGLTRYRCLDAVNGGYLIIN